MLQKTADILLRNGMIAGSNNCIIVGPVEAWMIIVARPERDLVESLLE